MASEPQHGKLAERLEVRRRIATQMTVSRDGDIPPAVRQREQQGRVHEIFSRDERLTAIARAYLQRPDATIVVSPDHQSRRAINERRRRLVQNQDPSVADGRARDAYPPSLAAGEAGRCRSLHRRTSANRRTQQPWARRRAQYVGMLDGPSVDGPY